MPSSEDIAEKLLGVTSVSALYWCMKHENFGTDMECKENGMGLRACEMILAKDKDK